jgi:RNA polymerase sigma-70 factor (ECF subfamily)
VQQTPACLEPEIVSLYGEYAPSMLRYALLLTGDTHAAQDAVQEAFLRYFVHRGNGQPIRSPKAWLARVMRNFVLDTVKKADGKFHLDSSRLRGLSSGDGGHESFHLADTLAAVLTARELECLRLRAEGFCYADVADILGIRPGTVAALLARAHSKARKALAGGNGRRALSGIGSSPEEATHAHQP